MTGALAIALNGAAFPLPATAGAPQEPKKLAPEDFLRLRRDSKRQPIALETAIVSFAPSGGRKLTGQFPRFGGQRAADLSQVTVDLVAVIHVADPQYFKELNRRLAGYDAVLYELVAPPNTRFAPGEAPPDGSMVGFAQRLVTFALGLQYQLDGIDYTRPNFVHADMTPEQFQESMRRRGESTMQIIMRLALQGFSRQESNAEYTTNFWEIFRQQGAARNLTLKRWVAEQFQEMGAVIEIVEGKDGSTILAERNKVALRVLREQIAAGKKKLAIFYGAAHMPDFAERLSSQFQMQPTKSEWIVAWDLREPGK